MHPYAKFIAAVIGGLLTIAAQLLRQHYGVDLGPYEAEIINAAGALVTSVLVWAVPNAPPEPKP